MSCPNPAHPPGAGVCHAAFGSLPNSRPVEGIQALTSGQPDRWPRSPGLGRAGPQGPVRQSRGQARAPEAVCPTPHHGGCLPAWPSSGHWLHLGAQSYNMLACGCCHGLCSRRPLGGRLQGKGTAVKRGTCCEQHEEPAAALQLTSALGSRQSPPCWPWVQLVLSVGSRALTPELGIPPASLLGLHPASAPLRGPRASHCVQGCCEDGRTIPV